MSIAFTKLLRVEDAGCREADFDGKANPWQVQLVADYNLSQRTDVYLLGAYARNAGLGLDTAVTGYATGHQLAAGKNDVVRLAVGIRHKF